MTVRTIGQIEKTARLSLTALAVALAVGTPLAVTAQQTEAPAPTPAPSSTFRLPPATDGRTPGVQGPADNGLPPLSPGERPGQPTPTPAPQPSTPTVVPTQPTATTPTAPARRDTPTGQTGVPRAAPPTTVPINGTTTAPSAPAAEAPSAAPGFTTDPTVPAAGPTDQGAVPAAPLAAAGGGTPIWAWLLAALVAIGAGYWYWRRRPATAGGAPADFDPAPIAPRPAAPKTAAPTPATRAAKPALAPAPRPATPQPRAPLAPAISPLVTRPADERRAIVAMALDIRGIRLTPEQLIVAFSLNLLNQGPVAATGMMVRIALNQGTAMTEPVVARFFDGAGGSVLRDDMHLDPGAGEQLSTEVMLPRAAVEPLIAGGKPVLVPVLAFDVTYHWDGEGDAFGQNAGTFVLGREQGASGSEKLAPLPLDRPNLVVNHPAARATALKRAQ